MPQPATAQCPDKQGISADIQLAMKVMIDLCNRQMEAVIAGDLAKTEALQQELREAREWKDSMLESYRQHLREHGC